MQSRACVRLALFFASAAAAASATECDTSAVFDVANAYYPSCEGLYYVLAQSMPVMYTSRLCSDADCQQAFSELRALELEEDCTMFGNTTLEGDILDQCPETSSASASTAAASTAEEAESDLCDIAALFSVADAHYPSCEGLYYVLAQSMPANYTAELCDSADCARALAQLRALGLGDCVVFGETTLTTDILDQCPSASASSSGAAASATTSTSRPLSAGAGAAIVLAVLAFVGLVVAATMLARRQTQAKRSLQRLAAADDKLARAGDSDAPYSSAVDLQASAAALDPRRPGQAV